MTSNQPDDDDGDGSASGDIEVLDDFTIPAMAAQDVGLRFMHRR